MSELLEEIHKHEAEVRREIPGLEMARRYGSPLKGQRNGGLMPDSNNFIRVDSSSSVGIVVPRTGTFA